MLPWPAALLPSRVKASHAKYIAGQGILRLVGPRLMSGAILRCAECNCSQATCTAAETAGDCQDCSQAANVSAECCCWQAAHGLA